MNLLLEVIMVLKLISCKMQEDLLIKIGLSLSTFTLRYMTVRNILSYHKYRLKVLTLFRCRKNIIQAV